RIASQDVHTPAGYKAIDLLGNRHLDQNRPLAALRQLLRLINSETARSAREPLLSIRTAAAWSNLGRPDQARLTLIELTRWLGEHPEIKSSVLDGEVPDAADVSEWLNKNLPPAFAGADSPSENRHFAGGLLPLSSSSAFSSAARILWKSNTSGFNVPIMEEDRAKFRPQLEAEDDNAPLTGGSFVEPYPVTEAETAALVEAGLEHLAQRDKQRGIIPLPACEPVVVDGRVVFRTLNRLRSVDLKTGTLQWESFIRDAAFAEQFKLLTAPQSVNIPKESNDLTNPLNQRQSAVIYSRSREDRTAGTLSTDGDLLFTLEDGGVTAKATSYSQPGLRYAAPRESNQLCAFELETGILRWQIGGSEGEYKLPAAGNFFLGVPTVFGDSIYVLGEQAGWVRLFCLEPDTGNVKWVQPIATASVAVNVEGLRRIGGISPCTADGLIVCPLTSGLVVAFDVEQQRLAWISHYRSQVVAQTMARRFSVGPVPINATRVDQAERWRYDSTLALAGRIVLAPLDSQELICLDAVSGDTLWTQPRGQGLFVGAAFDDRVIVVDESAVRAVSLSDGSPIWTARLNQRVPTGRGLRIGSLFHLPVASVTFAELTDSVETASRNLLSENTLSSDSPRQAGKLVTIDLMSGRLLAESATPDGVPFGNLLARNGHIVSQRFDSVVALESLSTVELQLDARLQQKPDDAELLEVRARIRLHEGKLAEGLNDLRLAVQNRPTETALSLLVEQSLEQLRYGQELNEDTKRVLAAAQLDAQQRNALDAVRAARLVDRNHYTAAFDLLLHTPQTDPKTGSTFIVHADPLSRSSKVWGAAQLQSVYDKAASPPPDATAVTALEQLIRQELVAAKAAVDVEALRTWLSRFSWHRLSAEAAVALAERLDIDKDGPEIDSLWAILATHSTAEIAAAAKQRLPQPAQPIAWPESSPEVTTAGHNLSADRRVLVDVAGSRSPAIDGWQFELSLSGLTALDATGNPEWTLTDADLGSDPLLTTSRHNSSRVFSSGHLLAVSTGTEFSVFDIRNPSPRRLWLRSLLSNEAAGFFQMRRTHVLGSSVLVSESTAIGSVDFLNSHSLVYRTGSTLRTVSAATGETIWTRDRISPESLIFGDELRLSVVSLRNAHCQLFDIRTGTLLAEHFDIPLNGILATVGTDPIVRQIRSSTHLVSRFDMRSGTPIWEYELPGTAMIRPDNGNRLVELHRDGQILIREQSTGSVIIEVQGQKQLLPGVFFIHETPTGYVLFTATPQRDFQSQIRPL
ncbi:MAG: PQQ-binding-like beta-propeller repeat protein, partial [Planctomycetota bacterium]|nr:PQQ-binding-like beta-propeller repeat protein [Planctomycetota bacterium]